MKISSSEKRQSGDVTLGTDGALVNEVTVASCRSKLVRLSGIEADEAVVETADISWEDSCYKRLSNLK